MRGAGTTAACGVLIGAAVLLSSDHTGAAPGASVRAACLNDAKKFCASVIQNNEARRHCMVGHSAELSDGCKAAIAAHRAASGKTDLGTCRKLAHDKYFINGGRRLNNAVGQAIVRCMKSGPSAL
jgi:hypothetical protein